LSNIGLKRKVLKREKSNMESMILVVDDERSIANAAALVLENEGYCVLPLYCASDALALLSKLDVAVILSDVNMSEMDGMELAVRVRELCPRTGILLMSGDETTEIIRRREGCEGCAFEIMAKPFDARQLITKIKGLVY
jgi:two-component system response regulator FlrC